MTIAAAASNGLANGKLSRQDFVAPVDVRWCPGCGDYAILSAIQKTFPELGIPRENFVVVSGIGCSSRFPYYMKTYGFHSIHGRAPTVAAGIRIANPELSVWLITGDGDGLSIGGNHLLHLLRRNLDIKVLLFNNRIYGLTKGQYSPTSEVGKRTKSSPYGSIDYPINPLCFALAAEATFVARTMDTNPKHMSEVFSEAARHKGAAFIEILQNCVIFNDGAWDGVSAREVRDDRLLMLDHGKPLLFGREHNKGIRVNGIRAEIATLGENGLTEGDLMVHDAKNPNPAYAYLLTQMNFPDFPVPMGVFRAVEGRPTYVAQMLGQINTAIEKEGRGDLQSLLKGEEFWEVAGEAPASTTPGAGAESREGVADEQAIMHEQHEEANRFATDPLFRALRSRLEEALQKYGAEEVVALTPADSIAKAIEAMKSRAIGSLPVVDQGKLVGIVSERDILQKVVLKSIDRDSTPVAKIMTHHPQTLSYWNSVGDAINKLHIGGFRHLPINLRSGKLGLISVKGLLSFLYEEAHKGH